MLIQVFQLVWLEPFSQCSPVSAVILLDVVAPVRGKPEQNSVFERSSS